MMTELPFPTFIAEATRLSGQINSSSAAHVYGILDGDFHQLGLEPLQIGRTGWIHGCIESQGPVIVEGRVDGDIRSRTKIRLTRSATVRGNLTAPLIEIRPGAILEGEVYMEATQQSTLQKSAA